MEKFYAEPTLEALNLFKKKELIDAAKHFNLEVNESVSKAELKKLVLDYLVEEELMAEPEFTDELRGEQLLELKRLEFQERERERENQVKLKELELKEKELAIQLRPYLFDFMLHGPDRPTFQVQANNENHVHTFISNIASLIF